MQSSSERIADVLKAWHAVIGDNEITSSQILKRTAGGAQRDPAVRKLRDALRALFPRQRLNAQRLGMWLAKHCGSESDDLRLSGDYDSNKNRWIWCVFRPASIEQIESEFQESAQRFIERREEKLVGKGLDQRLKQLEKDKAKLESLAEERRAYESDSKYKECESTKSTEAANAEAQQVIDAAAKPSQLKAILLTPMRARRFMHRPSVEGCARKVRDAGFKCDVIDYQQGYAVRVFNIELAEARKLANRLLFGVHEIASPLKARPGESEKVWCMHTQRWVDRVDNGLRYVPEAKFIRRALSLDRQGSGAIKLKPLARWSPFDV